MILKVMPMQRNSTRITINKNLSFLEECTYWTYYSGREFRNYVLVQGRSMLAIVQLDTLNTKNGLHTPLNHNHHWSTNHLQQTFIDWKGSGVTRCHTMSHDVTHSCTTLARLHLMTVIDFWRNFGQELFTEIKMSLGILHNNRWHRKKIETH